MVGALFGRRSTGFARAVRSGAGLAIVGLLVAAASALAAAHFRPGAVYTGKTSACGSTIPGTTCIVRFRASTDGRSLGFDGKTVIDTWGCRGGGGEALLGGKARGATPIPLLGLRADGTLYGSVGYVLRPTSAPPEQFTSTVTGHLARAGKAAVVTFHNALKSGRSPCATQPVTITEQGNGLGGPR